MKWISHRGLHRDSVENTIDAFKRAEATGFTHIETDLRVSLDGHIVLSHDKDLKRISGQDIYVHQSTRPELENILLPKNQRLAFLDEVIELFPHLEWTFDIKDSWAPRCISALIDIIQEKNLTNWIESHVKFLVWNRTHEHQLLKAFPNARFYADFKESRRAGLGLVTGFRPFQILKTGKTYGLPPRFFGIKLFRKKFVDHYHSQGAFANAFLPKTMDEAKMARDAGFDEVLTDFPPLS